jgi:hypothetical protein
MPSKALVQVIFILKKLETMALQFQCTPKAFVPAVGQMGKVELLAILLLRDLADVLKLRRFT